MEVVVVVGRTASEAVELAALLLGGLVVVRVALGLAAGVLCRGAGTLASTAAVAARALRPGLARRLAATALGLGAPAVAVLPPVAAAPVQAVPGVPLHDQPGSESRAAAVTSAHHHSYVVRSGDTLWDIARRHLPDYASAAQVARAWPLWFAANRDVIGPDPSHIVPGQHLRVPGRRSAGMPTQPHAAPAPTTGTTVPPALSLDPDRR
jgi:nucleoid-associated protein YgaU